MKARYRILCAIANLVEKDLDISILSNFLSGTYKLSCGLLVECSPTSREVFGSSQGRVIPKTLKMVLIASLLSTQHERVGMRVSGLRIRDRSGAHPYLHG